MLTQCDLVQYLLSRDLVSAKSIVDGDLVIVDASRRNHNFKVICKEDASYLVKQGIDADRIRTVTCEAAVHQYLQAQGGHESFTRYLPHFYEYDEQDHVLVVELVRSAETLREYHVRRGRFPISIATEMGNALGTLHRLTPNGDGLDHVRRFSRQPPGVLSLHRPSLRIFCGFSSANVHLVRYIQQVAGFSDLLDGARQEWRADSLIHGDLKLENCLAFPRCASRRETGVKIVDWEMAGLGDPAWDVGSVFMTYLSLWLLSIPITGESSPDRLAQLARYPLNRMQPAIHAFWTSYVQRMQLDIAAAGEVLCRATRCAAVRLVQTAYEQMQESAELTGNVIYFLQLSLNMLRRPQEAVVHLLGIPLE